MSTLLFSARNLHSTDTSRPSNGLSAIIARLRTEWQARKATRAVESLSDEMLHDIGVSRSEIDDAVRFGRRSRR